MNPAPSSRAHRHNVAVSAASSGGVSPPVLRFLQAKTSPAVIDTHDIKVARKERERAGMKNQNKGSAASPFNQKSLSRDSRKRFIFNKNRERPSWSKRVRQIFCPSNQRSSVSLFYPRSSAESAVKNRPFETPYRANLYGGGGGPSRRCESDETTIPIPPRSCATDC